MKIIRVAGMGHGWGVTVSERRIGSPSSYEEITFGAIIDHGDRQHTISSFYHTVYYFIMKKALKEENYK